MRTPARRFRHLVGVVALVLAGIALLLGAIATVIAAALPDPVPNPVANPARTYAEGLARVAKLKALDGPQIEYGTELLTHGSRAETAVVIYYGYTNSYPEFRDVTAAYYRAGYNVLIPRIPGHGDRNPLSHALTQATAPALVQTIDESVDAAAGLGRHVEVVGLSAGGTMAMWAAYNRDEVDTMIAISPLMLPVRFPTAVVKPTTTFIRVLPRDIFIWWNPLQGAKRNEPPYGYPEWSLKSLAAFLDLSFDMADKPPHRTTRMARAGLITNRADFAVSWTYAVRIFEQRIVPLADSSWRYHYPARDLYGHDLVDPDGDNAANIRVIYQTLFPMLGLPAPRAK